MPQAFPPSTILVIKLVFLGALLLLAAAIAIAKWRMAPANARQAAVMQPIPFSHQHHVGDDGLDCRYCHTTVETSRFAGLPSTQICLTCHSQLFIDAPMLAPLHQSAARNQPIKWLRVHDLPDFVYFDHSIHVNKGVACVECHGRVDKMPLLWRTASLEMQWCLDCHRNAPQHLRPQHEVFLMQDKKPMTEQEVGQLKRSYQLQSVQRLTDCSTCHR